MNRKIIIIFFIFLICITLICFKFIYPLQFKLTIYGINGGAYDPYLFIVTNNTDVEVKIGPGFDSTHMKFDEKYRTVRNFEFVKPTMYIETFQLTSDEQKHLKELLNNIKKSQTTKRNQISTGGDGVRLNINGQDFYSLYYNDVPKDLKPSIIDEYYNKDLVDVANMLVELSNLDNIMHND